MNITEEVISDLLPLYFAHECSSETKILVEEYFQEHQEFEQQSRQNYKDPFANNIPSLTPAEEVRALKSTRRWMKMRSFVIAFAIFFSLCPFSYYHTANGSAFLFLDHPTEALIYVPFAVVFWCIYFGMKRRLRTG